MAATMISPNTALAAASAIRLGHQGPDHDDGDSCEELAGRLEGYARERYDQLTAGDATRQVDAVLDVIAPRPDIPPDLAAALGVVPGTRVPVIRFDWEGQAVMPNDEQIRGLAEQIVTAIRTAGP